MNSINRINNRNILKVINTNIFKTDKIRVDIKATIKRKRKRGNLVIRRMILG
jgi:hypothetical protein